MHPISSTLAVMVSRAAAKARLSQQTRVDAHDFERAVYRALVELNHTRPRLVAFAPAEALERVLALPDMRRRLDGHEERWPVLMEENSAPTSQFRLLFSRSHAATQRVRGIATKVAVGALAVSLFAGGSVPAIAGAPHRERHRGHHQHDVSAQAKRKGSKTVEKTFSNDGTVEVPAFGSTLDIGPADPYPTTIPVTGFKRAQVTDVNLTLNSLNHNFPADVDVLLVAPGGRNAVVMDDVGNDPVSSTVINITVTLDDEAAAALPADSVLTSGAFRPLANGEPNELDFPAPAPAPSGNSALSTFDGINPNGEWQLFVVDDAQGDAGSLDNGWTLAITAKAKIKGKGKRKH